MNEPRRDVEDVVINVAHQIDLKDWKRLRALFDEHVETDYTSLFGGEAQRQPADDLVAGWEHSLGRVVTQHMLGPIAVVLSGHAATARCHVRGDHFLENAPSGDTWTVIGHYVFQLEQRSTGWKVRSMQLDTFHQLGNRSLLQEAGQVPEPAEAQTA